MNSKLRRRIIKKLAQVTPGNLPTDQVVQSIPIPPPPPTFQASAIYPNIHSGFNQASIPIIDNLVSLLNNAVHYSSAGAVNFQTFRNNNFIFDASDSPSVDQRNLMNLSKLVYVTLLNSGLPFTQKLSGEQVHNMIDKLLTSPFFQNLSHISPTGPLAAKIQGNLKTLINDLFIGLKNINPKVQ